MGSLLFMKYFIRTIDGEFCKSAHSLGGTEYTVRTLFVYLFFWQVNNLNTFVYTLTDPAHQSERVKLILQRLGYTVFI